MDKTRNLLLVTLSQWTLFFLLANLAISTQKEWVDTLPHFKDPENRWLNNVILDLEDNVFVGGENVLHRFSPNLELKETVTTGPVMNHPDCPYPLAPCSKKKVKTDNPNTVLQMVYHLGPRPFLLLCGTVYRRICQLRPVDNLTEYHWVAPFGQPVGYTGGPYSTVATLGRGYNDQLCLFTASTDNYSYGIRVNAAPFLTSKVIKKIKDRYFFQYAFDNGTVKSAMEFKGLEKRSVIGGGFVYDGFIYYLIINELVFYGTQTNVIRVCASDGTFESYSELPISCQHKSDLLNGILGGHMGDSSSSEGKSLYVLFSRLKGENAGTALCIFPMSEIVHAFENFPRRCSSSGSHHCLEMKNDVTDFCGPDVHPYRITEPLVVPYFIFHPKKSITAVTTVKNNNKMVVILGQNDGLIKKISLSTGQLISFNDMLDINTRGAFRSPFVFDRDHKHIYTLINNKVVKYPVETCNVHRSCESCLSGEGKTDPLNCGWCAGQCAHLNECTDPGSFSRDTCTPSISEVYPQKGPIQGGVKIKITGDSLGSYIDGANISITVVGIPCEVFDWKNREVTCILGPAPEGTSGLVELYVSMPFSSSIGYSIIGSISSHLNFSYYVGPRPYAIFPNKGPTSGGTQVTIFGENLDFEKTLGRFFIVRGRHCNLKEFNGTTAKCVIENVTRPDYPDKIAIVVGNVTYLMDENLTPTSDHPDLSQSFEYVPDPEIHRLQPGFTTVSGLMNVTVTGLYLDSVLHPKIVVEVPVSKNKKMEFPKECWPDPEFRGTILTCATPSLLGKPWVPIPSRINPLQTHVSFIMDGVQYVKEFSEHQEYMSRLLYYPDPEFKTFRDIEKIVGDQTAMEIKGNHLDFLPSANNFQIKLGEKESCKISSVTTELLVCDLPPILKNSSVIGTNFSVEVFMGSTSQHLGYIEIMPLEQNHSFWGLLAICVLGLLSVAGVTCLCFRKLRKKKPLFNFRNITISDRTEVPHDYRLVQSRSSPPTIRRGQLSCTSSIPNEVVTATSVATTGPAATTATGSTDAGATCPTVASSTSLTFADATATVTANTTATTDVNTTATTDVNTTATTDLNTSVGAISNATTDATMNIENQFNMLHFLDRKKLILLEEKGLIIQKTELIIEKMIGSGHFGQVFKGTLQRPSEKRKEIAIKTLHRHVWSNPIEAENFMKEALKMKDFDHPHVLGLLGVYFEGGRVPFIVLPFMENGDVLEYIKGDKTNLKVAVLVKFAVDVASGMCYLSELNFVHRDLAARNCVLNSRMEAKVADFGMSRNMYGSNYYCTRDKKAMIPIKWMAPEAIDPGIYTTKSDVWSYGILLWELMTRGSNPYAGRDNWDVVPYIKSGHRLPQPEKCPEPLYLGMLACWNTDPNKRPDFFKLRSYVSKIHEKLLRNTKINAATSSTTVKEDTSTGVENLSAEVAGNAKYCNDSVPAQNTNYYNSEELYLQMNGKCLNEDVLE